MRYLSPIPPGARAAATVLALVLFATACKPAPPPAGPPPKPAAPKANSVPAVTNVVSNKYISVFTDLPPPKGVDPFFPDSHRRDPAAPAVVISERPQPAANILLKGVVGAPSHRLAVLGGGLNNTILETGESGTLRTASGSMRVKCIEIGENYAVIRVEGESQFRRLELNKK